MKLAARINSYLRNEDYDINKTFIEFNKAGINYVDLNYPEHVVGIDASDMKSMLEEHNLKANGVALRFRSEFINGDLGNPDQTLAKKALELTKSASDYCREIGGKVVTIWLGNDGFDYSFQINYSKVWDQLINAFQEICDYAPDLKISIEYKPYEERSYAFIDSMGVAGMFINEIDRGNIGITLDYCHMLMKHENPAFAADIFSKRSKLFGVHLNDGYGVMDDGLMIGTASPYKTLEFLFYIKKNGYDGPIYFDTFPIREPAIEETEINISMIKYMNDFIDNIGLDKIQEVIDKNSAIESSKLILEFLKTGGRDE